VILNSTKASLTQGIQEGNYKLGPHLNNVVINAGSRPFQIGRGGEVIYLGEGTAGGAHLVDPTKPGTYAPVYVKK
jgi:hypothetical protein